MNCKHGFSFLLICVSLTVLAGESSVTATGRNNGTNFRDRALASCIATAYRGASAGADADITTSAFIEWTYYDLEGGNPAVDELVARYLRRDYSNPMEGYAGARFDLLKCLDMYHSQELESLVRQYVPRPDWVGDKPPARGKTAGNNSR